MKWFFALNQGSNKFEEYVALTKVTLLSAQKNTTLEPYFLWDGGDCELTAWLQARHVPIIRHRSFLYEALRELGDKTQNPRIVATGAGAFLRTEIPQMALQHNWNDRFVLYTDCDVLFLQDVCSDLEKLTPKYFAVAPQFKRGNYRDMNTGVMLMNLPALRAQDAKFRLFMLQHLPALAQASWDQTAYRMFYGPRFSKLPGGEKWDHLPGEMNWKAYWGDCGRAQIIHFHGLKPYHRDLVARGELRPTLQKMATGCYLEICALWDDLLREAA